MIVSTNKKEAAIRTYNKAVKQATSSGMSNAEILEIHNSVKKQITPKKETQVAIKKKNTETNKGKKQTTLRNQSQKTEKTKKEKKPPLLERKNLPPGLRKWKENKSKKESKD